MLQFGCTPNCLRSTMCRAFDEPTTATPSKDAAVPDYRERYASRHINLSFSLSISPRHALTLFNSRFPLNRAQARLWHRSGPLADAAGGGDGGRSAEASPENASAARIPRREQLERGAAGRHNSRRARCLERPARRALSRRWQAALAATKGAARDCCRIELPHVDLLRLEVSNGT